MKGTHISKHTSRRRVRPFQHVAYTYPERSPRLPQPIPPAQADSDAIYNELGQAVATLMAWQYIARIVWAKRAA